MALNDLTLSVVQGVRGRPFKSKIGGKTAGTVIDIENTATYGFQEAGGFVNHDYLPHDVNTVALLERNVLTGETKRTRIQITGVTGETLAAQAAAAVTGPRTVRKFSADAMASVDGSLEYSLYVENDLGSTVVVAVGEEGGTEPLPTSNALAVHSLWTNFGSEMGQMVMTGVLPSAKTGVRMACSKIGDWTDGVLGAPVDSTGIYTNLLVSPTLDSDADYYAALYVDGAVQTQSVARFRTPRTSGNVAFALGGCTYNTADRTLFDFIRTYVPSNGLAKLDFFTHRGDWGYADDTTLTVAEAHVNMATNLSWPKARALLLAMPVPFKGSDHDSMAEGESDANTGGPERATVANYKTFATQRLPVDLGVPISDGLANVWRIGRNLFFDVMERLQRDPHGTVVDSPAKRNLGAAVEALYAECVTLCAAQGWTLVYLGDLSWHSTQPLPNPSWNAYTYERTRLSDYESAADMAYRCPKLHSDFHLSAVHLFADFSTTQDCPQAVICGGPVGRTESAGVVTPFSEGQHFDTAFQVQIVEITDAGGDTSRWTVKTYSLAANDTDPSLAVLRQTTSWLVPHVLGADLDQEVINDTFTAADGTTLLAHAEDGAWGQQSGYSNIAAAISNNRLHFPGGGTSGYCHSTIAPRGKVKIEFGLDYIGAHASDQVGVYLRGSSTSDSMYFGRYSKSTGTFAITKISSGSAAAVGTNTADAFTSGSRDCVFAIDDHPTTPTITLHVDGVLVASYTDASPIVKSRGVGVRSTNGQTTTTGRHISYFRVISEEG